MFSPSHFNLSAISTTLIDTPGRFRARPPETVPVRRSKLCSHGQPKKKKTDVSAVLIGTPWNHSSLPILIKTVISVCPGNWKPQLSVP